MFYLDMSYLDMIQITVVSLFALSLFTRMWKHSISVFIILGASSFLILLYPTSPLIGVIIFTVGLVYVTIRGSLKPKGERFWI